MNPGGRLTAADREPADAAGLAARRLAAAAVTQLGNFRTRSVRCFQAPGCAVVPRAGVDSSAPGGELSGRAADVGELPRAVVMARVIIAVPPRAEVAFPPCRLVPCGPLRPGAAADFPAPGRRCSAYTGC